MKYTETVDKVPSHLGEGIDGRIRHCVEEPITVHSIPHNYTYYTQRHHWIKSDSQLKNPGSMPGSASVWVFLNVQVSGREEAEEEL